MNFYALKLSPVTPAYLPIDNVKMMFLFILDRYENGQGKGI